MDGCGIVKVLSFGTVALLSAATPAQGWRDESFSPNFLEREGMALCRIVGSPCSIVTLPCGMWRDEMNAHDGEVDPFSAVLIPPFGLVAGCLCTCLELCVGTTELLTFQQFKSQTYPWELPKATEKEEYLANERKYEAIGREFAKDMMDSAKEVAVDVAVQSASAGIQRGIGLEPAANAPVVATAVTASPVANEATGASKNPKPRMRHSSCRGTGDCNVCKGRGYLGKDSDNSRLRCRSCGGSGRCRACGGSGWAN